MVPPNTMRKLMPLQEDEWVVGGEGDHPSKQTESEYDAQYG